MIGHTDSPQGGFLLPAYYLNWVHVTGKAVDELIALEAAEPQDRSAIYDQKILLSVLFIEHGYTSGISPYDTWTGAEYKTRLEKEIGFVFKNSGNFWDYDRSIS